MTKTIGIVLFPGMEELDFVGPLEVFGAMAFLAPGEWRVVTVAESPGPVRAFNGLKVQPDHTFDDAPPLDVVLVPGGWGTRKESENPRMIDFLRKVGESASWVTSVCTGAFVLHAAGFLAGRRATTHWGSVEQLRGLSDIEVVDNERWVQDRNVITAAGVSAGIDMALYLVSLLKDEQTAANVQKMMEYYPQPPSFESIRASRAEAPA